VTELGKKPKSYDEIQGQYLGLFKISAKVLKDLCAVYDQMDREAIYDGKDFDNMYMTSFLQHLINLDWKVKAVPVERGWLEVDTVEDLEFYEKSQKDGTLKEQCNLELIQ